MVAVIYFSVLHLLHITNSLCSLLACGWAFTLCMSSTCRLSASLPECLGCIAKWITQQMPEFLINHFHFTKWFVICDNLRRKVCWVCMMWAKKTRENILCIWFIFCIYHNFKCQRSCQLLSAKAPFPTYSIFSVCKMFFKLMRLCRSIAYSISNAEWNI